MLSSVTKMMKHFVNTNVKRSKFVAIYLPGQLKMRLKRSSSLWALVGYTYYVYGVDKRKGATEDKSKGAEWIGRQSRNSVGWV